MSDTPWRNENLLLAGVVLAIIILLNRQRNPYLRVASWLLPWRLAIFWPRWRACCPYQRAGLTGLS